MSKNKITDPKEFNFYINNIYHEYIQKYSVIHSENLLIQKFINIIFYIHSEKEKYDSLTEYFEKKHDPKTFFLKDLYSRDNLLLNHFWDYVTDELVEHVEIEIEGYYIPFYDPSINFIHKKEI